jgi:hypothetical protein
MKATKPLNVGDKRREQEKINSKLFGAVNDFFSGRPVKIDEEENSPIHIQYYSTIFTDDPKLLQFLTLGKKYMSFGDYEIVVENKKTSRTKITMQKFTGERMNSERVNGERVNDDTIYYVDSTEHLPLNLRNKITDDVVRLDLTPRNYTYDGAHKPTPGIEKLVFEIARMMHLEIPKSVHVGGYWYKIPGGKKVIYDELDFPRKNVVRGTRGTICAEDSRIFEYLTGRTGETDEENVLDFGNYEIYVERKITSRTKLIMQKITDDIKYIDIEKIYYIDSTENVPMRIREKFAAVEKITLNLNPKMITVNGVFDANDEIENLVLYIAEIFNLPIPDRVFLGRTHYNIGLTRSNYHTNNKLNEYIFRWKRKNGTDRNLETNS